MLTEPAPLTMRLSLPLILLLLGAWAIPGGFGDRAPLTATAPQLDDEEKYSAHMPAHLRCDACRAVVYQLWGPRSEPGETSHRPRAQQGARAKHQRDDHRGPLAHQALQDMFALPGGVWRRPDLRSPPTRPRGSGDIAVWRTPRGLLGRGDRHKDRALVWLLPLPGQPLKRAGVSSGSAPLLSAGCLEGRKAMLLCAATPPPSSSFRTLGPHVWGVGWGKAFPLDSNKTQ
uniref:Marginal zone B and B1 cell specific protein n=1 Tax=Ursus maritimus TaxID=29073 RepID=A0A452UKV5_URSMA